MRALAFFLVFSISWATSVCIENIDEDSNEPYLRYAILRYTERALLQNGISVSCEEESIPMRLRVVKFTKTPISYSPAQRVSSYNLYLKVKFQIEGYGFTISGIVPYTQTSGAVGDIPRRVAIDDLLDTIYPTLLNKLRRWKDAHKQRDQQERGRGESEDRGELQE